MYKKTDIEDLERRIPFTVPSGYFQELKFEIQKQCITKEKDSGFSVFQFKTLVPALGILLVFITLFNNIETTISEVELTKNDLIAYLENNLSDELLYEYAILEDEKEDDELSDEIDYLLEYDMEYNLIINQL
jgi:hypothetical protein|tara:strand:- start:635 stop:1030 length:396 start_codon:yes stop_codon:yes gene_type:complete